MDKNKELDQRKLSRLRMKILLKERENLKTGKKSQRELTDEIRKIIEREVLD